MHDKLKIRPHNAFLVIGLVFGLLFLFLTPPFQAPDEESHFYKVYYLSEGNVLPQEEHITIGYYFPSSLENLTQQFAYIRYNPQNKQDVDKLFSLFNLPLSPGDKVPIKISNIATYPPMSYLAAAILFLIFKTFNTAPLILMYLGRLINLFIWLILVFFAIRTTPVHKWIFFLLALMPMTLFLAPTLSADSFNTGLSFLVIAYFFRLAFDEKKEKVEKRDIVIVFLFIMLLSLAKQGYAILLLLFLMIPQKKFDSPPLKRIYFLLIGGLILVGNFLWNFLFKDLYIPSPESAVSSAGQITFLLANPLHFLYVLQKTLITNFNAYLVMFVGDLGWLDTFLPPLMIYLYLAVLIIYAILDKNKQIVYGKQKLMALLTFLIIFVLIFAFEYITWTPVGASFIAGVQSRYFIPMVPLIFLLFYNRVDEVKINDKIIPFRAGPYMNLALIIFVLIFLSVTMHILFSRYYVP